MTSADQLEGLDLAALDSYLRSLGIGRDGELRAEFISGGRSNLTFRVYDDATSWLVRRPPLHGLTPSAHDMAREYRVVAALQDTPVPVARTIGLCEDESVLGAPFQIVEFVAGQVGALWSSLIAGFVILILLLIFITQNTAPTAFRFLGLHWSLPLGVAILLAAVVGGLITVAVGTARILQLRRVAKKQHAAGGR